MNGQSVNGYLCLFLTLLTPAVIPLSKGFQDRCKMSGSAPLSRGFGLLGMSERAERISAQLAIQSQPGQGTEIIVTINP